MEKHLVVGKLRYSFKLHNTSVLSRCKRRVMASVSANLSAYWVMSPDSSTSRTIDSQESLRMEVGHYHLDCVVWLSALQENQWKA